MTTPLRLALFLAAATLAPSARASDTPALAAAPLSFELDRVLHDEPGDGRLWARGSSWKASFAPDGTTYYPLFGPSTPRHYPLHLRVAEASLGGQPLAYDRAAVPTRQGDAIRYDRGSFVEVYETRLDSIEQLFVFDRLERGGELVIRVAAETELASSDGADALFFENAFGTVSYSRAIAIDARGERVDAPTLRTAQGIEVRVPADFVARARLPLVVDPVIKTYGIPMQFEAEPRIDVAFDPEMSAYVHVFEVKINQTDSDIHYAVLQDQHGYAIWFGPIDLTAEKWSRPAIAMGSTSTDIQHLVVAEAGPAGGRSIRGRRMRSTGWVSPPIDISEPCGTGDCDMSSPDVGGSESADIHYWAVVWQSEGSNGAIDLQARTVWHFGETTLGDLLSLDDSAEIDSNPSISSSWGNTVWNIVWQRAAAGGTHDVWGRRLNWNGEFGGPGFPICTLPSDDVHPRASRTLSDGTWLAVWEGANHVGGTFNRDIVCRAVEGDTPSTLEFLSDELDAFEGNPDLLDQVRPDVEADGESFVVGYAQQSAPDSALYDLHVMTVAMVGTRPRVAEGLQLFGGSPTTDFYPRVLALAHHGVDSRRFVVAARTTPSVILGAVYDAGQFAPLCLPAYDGNSCPCQNPPTQLLRGCNNSAGTGGARLEAVGVASLMQDTMTLIASDQIRNSMSIVMQGDVLLPPAPFGQGLSCVGGSVVQLYVRTSSAAGMLTAPIPGEPSISQRSAELGVPISPGTRRWYFVYYRDPIVSHCPTAAPFNTTPAIQTIWAP